MTDYELAWAIVESIPDLKNETTTTIRDICPFLYKYGSSSVTAEFSPATSRDDIHRAEMALDEVLRVEYIAILSARCAVDANVMLGDWFTAMTDAALFALATASPRQRAEALVRTLGGGE